MKVHISESAVKELNKVLTENKSEDKNVRVYIAGVG